MSQLRSAAKRWYQDSYQAIRPTGYYSEGVYQRIDPEPTPHKGNIQPATQKDIQRLPEGSRADGSLTLYTHSVHQTTESPNQVADRIIYKGITYEVSTGEEWQSHNRYVLTKVGQ